MKSEEEIREVMEKATKLVAPLAQLDSHSLDRRYLDFVYNILSWVVEEGNDPLEGY